MKKALYGNVLTCKSKFFALFVCILLIFSVCLINLPIVYGFNNEQIEFVYNDRIFNYNLSKNIKQSERFDFSYEINKYKRFGTIEERQRLLKTMLNLGFDIAVSINYLFPNLDATLERIEKNVKVKVKDANLRVDTNTNQVFFISDEVVGIDLDREELYCRIAEKYLTNKPMRIDVPTTKIMPKILKSDLDKFTHLRADFSTDISHSSADRKHNVKNALNSLNRIEIAPNQMFSFNKTVGRRTEANGYRTAKIIVNNEFVDGLGGGVCQVSTTLYNSALLAGLEIVEANKHSKQISYVKYGFDAMVNFGSSDLKFKNNTGEKITIITNYSPNQARIRIFGESLGNVSYKLKNEINNVVEPQIEEVYDNAHEYADKVEFEDESFVLKRGNRGMNVKSFREKYQGSDLVNCELLRTDKFKVQNTVKVFGTKKRPVENFNLAEIFDF